jgi:hypothetical protein
MWRDSCSLKIIKLLKNLAPIDSRYRTFEPSRFHTPISEEINVDGFLYRHFALTLQSPSSGFRIRIHFLRIRIQSGSRALMTKNWKKITAEKKIQFFLSKSAIYLSLGLHKVFPITEEASSSQKRPSNTSKHEFFLLLWVIFALLDPDPDSEYGSGSGSTGPIEYGSYTVRIRIRIRNPGHHSPKLSSLLS